MRLSAPNEPVGSCFRTKPGFTAPPKPAHSHSSPHPSLTPTAAGGGGLLYGGSPATPLGPVAAALQQQQPIYASPSTVSLTSNNQQDCCQYFEYLWNIETGSHRL